MRHLIFLIAFCTILPQRECQLTPAQKRRIDQFMLQMLRCMPAPGAAVAIVQNNQTLLSRGEHCPHSPLFYHNCSWFTYSTAIYCKMHCSPCNSISGLLLPTVVTYYRIGYGDADVPRNIPVTENTLFCIVSCSKSFAAMLAAMTIDRNK